ncbi:OB-fold protein [Lysobacter sp. Hz 25]|uniref:OB-fold protein n=1 Tax=Lysobacter sp. Hz 25 TaxID=3383698 RepID=UPI0038D42D40
MNTTGAPTSSTPNTAGRAAWICLAIAWIAFLLPIPGIGVFIGWPLNLVAFILAIVAMSKRGALGGLWQLLASLIASPIVYFIGLAIFAGVVGAAGEAGRQAKVDAPKAEISAAATADAITLDAATLHQAYEANEIAADQQYKGKLLRINGTIADVASDVSDDPLVSLRVSDFESVHAKGLAKDVAASLSKGQSITLTCTGDGEVIGTPVLSNCTL